METTNKNKTTNDLSTLPAHWEPVMFYVDVNYNTEDEYMIEMFNKYFEAYTIGRELSKKEKVPHYQVLAFQQDKSCYTNFIQRVKTKYKLVGRAVKGGRKQYGKIKKELQNIENAMIYTLKDKNYLNKWFDIKYVEGMAEQSYVKEDKKDKLDEVVKAAATFWDTEFPDTTDRCKLVTFIIDLYFKKFDRLIVQRTLYLILYKAKIMSSNEYASMIAKRWMSGCDDFSGEHWQSTYGE